MCHLVNGPTSRWQPENRSLDDDSSDWAYENLAMELIFLCRFFAQAYERSLDSCIMFKNVLTAADDALQSAAEARGQTSKEVDEKFREAIDLLRAFEKDLSSKDPTSDLNIGGVVTTFASTIQILHALKENLHAKPMGVARPHQTREVKFYLLSSLPDARPIVVQQLVSTFPSIQEILWNFSRFKDVKQRLTLRDNPHFYAELPTSPEAYGDSVKIDPTINFRDADEFYVLTDKSELVYITSDRVSQYFGNFWCPKNDIIFKDICGRLRGERVVKASLGGTCGFCEQLPVSTASRIRCGLQKIITQSHPRIVGYLPIHSSDDISLRVCIGRTAPDSPFLVPYPYIHILDNDSLLQIFSFYRLDDNDWNLQLTWRKLAHVCRKWRYLIYDSSAHLDICLLLTNDSPSMDTISHLPPLPLIINYSDRTRTIARKDEANIHLGLQQHGRVRQAVLQAPSSTLSMWLESMNNFFPTLRDLSLSSTTEEMNLMLPETFQAPDLHRLTLHGIGLPKGLSLLSSTIALSILSLTHIRESCYFPPGRLVTHLQGLPHLEELSIGLSIPIHPSSEGELLPAPIPPVTLHTLRRLTFHGEEVYIDNLVAQINTPLLERLGLTLLFNLAFTLVNLTEFIHRTEGFGCPVAQVLLNKDGASIDTTTDYHGSGKLSLHVNCEPLWQIDAAAQVCGALGKVLSTVEELRLDLDANGMPSDLENTLDNILWHELLLPFIGVKKLHIGSSLTLELYQALQSAAGGLVLELLPELQELEVQLEIDLAKRAFSAFVESRESVGRPIHLLGLSYIKYIKNVGRPYRNRASESISIYRTFIQAQEHTFRLYDELISVSHVVIYALKSATEAQKKISREADEKFKCAIEALTAYEEKFHSRKTVAERMAEAEAKDKRLKEKLRQPVEEQTMTVEFLIHRSPLDLSPIIVKQVLGPHSSLSEVLWNFSRFKDKNKRLTTEQNPHFYTELPTLPEVYGGVFRMEPIETFQHRRISILTDNPNHIGRVLLETARVTRAFGNVWVLNGTIIFKDVRGLLEGESFVGEAIQGIPNLWCFEEPWSPPFRQPSLSVTATQITSAEGIPIRDWREPILRMLRSQDANIRITDKPPSSSSPIYPTTSS